MQGSETSTHRSVLHPIRGQCCFLLYAQIDKIQEVTDQRRLPILWRSEVAKVMKNLIGFLAAQQGPLAVALFFLKVLYLLQPPNLS